MESDIIGNFPTAKPHCLGCKEPLTIENAWMTDGCPCNSKLGCNNINETRWRLLMELQQKQAQQLEATGLAKQFVVEVLAGQISDPAKVYRVVTDTANDAMLLAFALDGGFADDEEIEAGHLELAKGYCRIV